MLLKYEAYLFHQQNLQHLQPPVLFDQWSGIHSASGIILNLLEFNTKQIISIAISWEIIENSFIGNKIWSFFGYNAYKGDNLCNIFSDIFFVIFFSKSKKYLGEKISILLICFFFIYFQSYTFYLDDKICNNY